MDLIVGMLGFSVFGLIAGLVVALVRRAWVALAVLAAGGALLAALFYGWNSAPCTSDAAGCGMSRGFEALMLLSAAVPLACGALAALGWRLVSGTRAGLGQRLVAFLIAAGVTALIVPAFFT
ncbi:hypothetical protein [Seohaeicola zhoushanensis]|uniref:Uncharacterized protein n=1 Tax=Seohaeicola zhoushanensis TaxID=1569283 RepID=A0A8J3M4R4_9RHOB|nr:hypothetical protein [Seohaeicola zhoushanensis]GHF35797.1 hypothetical protein GCM10017056_04410 [Seohaeicola zhoushanensis]